MTSDLRAILTKKSTINPRLFEGQIAYIIGAAEDRVLFAEPGLVPLLELVVGRLQRPPEAVVVLSDQAI